MKIIFVGINFRDGKGGVASVLNEYSYIFPDALFISSTSSKNQLLKIYYGVIAVIKCICYSLMFSKAIFHIHGASYNSFHRKYIYFLILKFFRAKVIYHIHGAEYQIFYNSSDKRTKNKIKYFINNVDCLICLSSFWKDFFAKEFSPRKIKIIPNIVPAPINKKKKEGDVFNFLFLGHISKRKGVWLLLDVIERIKEKISGKIVFNFGGNGEIEKFKKTIKDKNLAEIVNYIGWISGDDKINHLSKADAFILPSYNEGLPISILEAMTYGLPIISTNVGGIPEIIKDKVNGLIIEPGSHNQLEESLKFVLQNNSEFKNFGRSSSQLIKPHLPENVKIELTKIYNSIFL